MTAVRVIEWVAYGPGTPDELADDVPTWAEMGVVPRELRPSGSFPTPLHHRFWYAAALAAAAGCPPHWADLGFVAGDEEGAWWHEAADIAVYRPGGWDEEAWTVWPGDAVGVRTPHPTERAARLHGGGLLGGAK